MTRPLALILVGASAANAQLVIKLHPDTLQAFNRYQQTVAGPEAEQRIRGARSFQWLDENPVERERARRGGSVTHSFTGRDGKGVPGGLIHDWVGAVYLSGARLQQVREFMLNTALHARAYPEVTSATTLARRPNGSTTRLRLTKKKHLTVVLDIEYDNAWQAPGADRFALTSRSRQVIEIDGAGTASERSLPPGEGHGFLWRMNSLWLLREDQGGVWAELRVVSLSRDTPNGLGWILKPLIRDFPAESLASTLEATRKVLAR
ncbi:MAG: hypothetical protein HYZ57_05595 [Acidobacteria bacterium]|nr:hypothetical protein [Acidobacteriota bacterium]MBI3279299.1 hypothetical protein [Acidobacteriota bacterium]